MKTATTRAPKARPFSAVAGFFFWLTLWPTPLQLNQRAHIIIWNVGQGQWITAVEPGQCLHFDTGGERSPLSRVQSRCPTGQNKSYFSHWDWDHIGFAAGARNRLTRFCVAVPPRGQTTSKKFRAFRGIPTCPESRTSTRVHEIAARLPKLRLNRSSNAESRVLVIDAQVLDPGDSTADEEKFWARHIPQAARIRVLIAGHHGSRTSTSETLLRATTGLRLTIVSARKARYGHPHVLVAKRLKAKGIAMLTTEDWGSIAIELR